MTKISLFITARSVERLPRDDVNQIIRDAYEYLDHRYPDEKYRHNFPSSITALQSVMGTDVAHDEMVKIVDTFAFHELGTIPDTYAAALHTLRKNLFWLP